MNWLLALMGWRVWFWLEHKRHGLISIHVTRLGAQIAKCERANMGGAMKGNMSPDERYEKEYRRLIIAKVWMWSWRKP